MPADPRDALRLPIVPTEPRPELAEALPRRMQAVDHAGARIEGSTPAMATVQVRYIVNDVDAAIGFYCQHLGFTEVMHPSPLFAMLSRGDLRLVLSVPGGQTIGGGSTLPDGRTPEPGGWNRFAVEVADLEEMVQRLRKAGAHFRGDIIQGVGGNQALVEDPSGNPIELFQPLRPEARLTAGS
jgi:catechol 2,3-dioxygenase-like lactoylglutathione lyase family enzyme